MDRFEIADVTFGRNMSVDQSTTELAALHYHYMNWRNLEMASKGVQKKTVNKDKVKELNKLYHKEKEATLERLKKYKKSQPEAYKRAKSLRRSPTMKESVKLEQEMSKNVDENA